jgi:hypothetical protein
MRINKTQYNSDHELLAPRPADLRSVRPPVGGTPTVDPEFYHRFKFEARTEAELRTKTARFFALMGEVQGFSTLLLRPYEVRVGAFFRTGLDVVYVVERATAGVR